MQQIMLKENDMGWDSEEMISVYDDGSSFQRAFLALMDLALEDRLELFQVFCMGCGKYAEHGRKKCKCEEYNEF